MALDKNYVDRTDFDVLQPAIDYYLKNGNADEKLRTYYYQGRIFQNRGDLESALNSFIKAIDISSDSSDSLCIARTLVAQGSLFNRFYDYDRYTACHLRAAKIYKNLSYRWHEFDCLLNALNGITIYGNKALSDSILSLCDGFTDLDDDQSLALTVQRLSQAVKFRDREEINRLIAQMEDPSELDNITLMDFALGYSEVGDNATAKHFLDMVNNGQPYDTLKYLSISVPVHESLGNYKYALEAYKEFSHTMDSIIGLRFDQKTRSIEERHKTELALRQNASEKAKILWISISAIVFLCMIVMILLLIFRSNKIQRDLAVERAKTSELENVRLKSEKDMTARQAKITELENQRLKSESEKLVLENNNLQLERDKKALEAENLAHRVEMLENESASLKELLDSPDELPSEVRQAIKVRIEMLNSLMAAYITANEQYGKPYGTWIKELTDNTDEFMNSNRLAFQASHPRFIQYLEEHDLTVGEINYVCLYAIGLRGKEVGSYIKKRSHVNISSVIRKKLGIDRHATNIGIYVRKLLKEL